MKDVICRSNGGNERKKLDRQKATQKRMGHKEKFKQRGSEAGTRRERGGEEMRGEEKKGKERKKKRETKTRRRERDGKKAR